MIPTTAAVAVVFLLAALVASFPIKAWRVQRQIAELRAAWGQGVDRERPMPAIASYFAGVAGSDEHVDDRTWSDLDMDAVFAKLDRTESSIGRQLLYARLRQPGTMARTQAFDRLATSLGANPQVRERVQVVLRGLAGSAGYDLWTLTNPDRLAVQRWHAVFPAAAITMALAAAGAAFVPQLLIILIIGALAGFVARSAVAPSLRTVTGAFRQVTPLLSAADALRRLDLDVPETVATALREDVPRLSRLRRIAAWAGRDSSGAIAGELQGIVIEYLNLLFWLDANALFFAARELRARGPELLRVMAAVGEIDAAIAVASFRAGTSGWITPAFQPDLPVTMLDLVHPLLTDAVPNALQLGPPSGLLITGSNMSGKSTFLRTAGVSVLMAQSICTCLAARYEAPWFVVRSCIGRGDDLQQGRSYYLAEVEAVLSMVRSAGSGARHLLIFDELFRGTNAVERIALAEAVLRFLVTPSTSGGIVPHIVLAATHDQELVDLLQPVYAAGHFTDTIDANGLSFDYMLKPGPAVTRNAIALLEYAGAPADIVTQARTRAGLLDGSRSRADA